MEGLSKGLCPQVSLALCFFLCVCFCFLPLAACRHLELLQLGRRAAYVAALHGFLTICGCKLFPCSSLRIRQLFMHKRRVQGPFASLSFLTARFVCLSFCPSSVLLCELTHAVLGTGGFPFGQTGHWSVWEREEVGGSAPGLSHRYLSYLLLYVGLVADKWQMSPMT